MSAFQLWLLTTAIPGLSNMASFLAFLGGVSLGVLLLVSLANRHSSQIFPEMESSKREAEQAVVGFKIVKQYAPYAIAALLVSSVLPSERQMLLIAGGYAATNSEEIAALPANAAKAANAWLEAIAEAAEPKKDK